ncbi:MAG: hypothetical protein AAGH88_11295 [Planctomycetota bacterium]
MWRGDLTGVASDPTSTRQAIRVTVNPPMSQWAPSTPSLVAVAARRELLDLAARRADRLGLVKPGGLTDTSPGIVATGHQAYPWHPGILVKDFAALAAAGQHQATPLHLVVDQDQHPVWQIDQPTVTGQRIVVDQLRLTSPHPDVPTGFQAPLDPESLRRWLGEAGLPVVRGLGEAQTLAEQASVVLDRWRASVGARLPLVFASDLALTTAFRDLIVSLLNEAEPAVRSYNRAVAALPGAGVRPLTISREWVELPLWACRWQQPRRRVYADLGDRVPILVDEAGTPLPFEQAGAARIDSPGDVTLMPRALLMTALMRFLFCDLFIHGTGGEIYDRVTERWWRDWRGEALSPIAMVTADAYLDLDAPTATRMDLQRAVWYEHHLPFNIDRFARVDPELALEKRSLIQHMDDDRDEVRRANAFRRIHDINRSLIESYPQLILDAQNNRRLAQAGVQNAAVLARRDWCFALYRPEAIAELRNGIRD